MIGRIIEFMIVRILSRMFPSRYRVIPRRSDGAPLLRQFKIFRWAYLQSFLTGEEEERFHVHRWRRMISFVLSGGFIEERYPGHVSGGPFGCLMKRHEAPSVYMMDHSTIHRLYLVWPRTWTLFLMFGDWKAWGYFRRPERVDYTPWDKAIPDELRVKAL